LPDVPAGGRPPEEVLDQVLRRGRQLRRRHRLAVRGSGALAVVTCMLGVAAAVSTAGPGPSRVVRAAGAPTTSTAVAESAPEVPTTAVPPTTTTAARIAPAPTTTTLVCRNSSDPRCGPFRWEPDPGPNQPLTVDITYEPSSPRAGETVTFHVTARDPDASQFPQMCSFFGDGSGPCISGVKGASSDPSAPDYEPYCGPMYGPWTPPVRPGQESLGNPPGSGVPHTYANAGTYLVRFSFDSSATFCGYAGPYASQGEGTVQVVVQPASPAQ
jgi:hypothetical protein